MWIGLYEYGCICIVFLLLNQQDAHGIEGKVIIAEHSLEMSLALGAIDILDRNMDKILSREDMTHCSNKQMRTTVIFLTLVMIY